MDLIYMNANKEDIGVMRDYTLDLAFGADENDFECNIVTSNHCCEKGFYLYTEGTEYGGIIDDIGVDTEKDEVTYYGRTWHGILDSKVLEPDSGEDYLVLSGEANTVLNLLVSRMGLNGLFKASEGNSGVNISSYKMNRYITGYDGIRKMLKASGAKLNIIFKNGFAELSAKPFVDYSKDEQFDTDQISFKIRKKGSPLNHVICLGKGDLSEREVIHVYADEKGNISDTQVLTGILEVSTTYENANVETTEELKQGGIDLIRESWNSDEIDFDFDSDVETYDVSDVVGAKEIQTGVEVRAEITKKIVTIKKEGLLVSYSCASDAKKTSSSSGGSSGGGGTSGGGGDEGITISQAEYDALPEAEKNNGATYYIYDADAEGNASTIDYNNKNSGLKATNVQGAVDEVNNNIKNLLKTKIVSFENTGSVPAKDAKYYSAKDISAVIPDGYSILCAYPVNTGDNQFVIYNIFWTATTVTFIVGNPSDTADSGTPEICFIFIKNFS